MTIVLLLLKFSRPFTNAIFVSIALSHESSFSFLTSIFRQNITLAIFKFSCFFIVLFVSNFLCSEYRTVWGITKHCSIYILFACTIITLMNLNNFEYPTKTVCVHRLTKITSYKICFRSRHAEINGNR